MGEVSEHWEACCDEVSGAALSTDNPGSLFAGNFLFFLLIIAFMGVMAYVAYQRRKKLQGLVKAAGYQWVDDFPEYVHRFDGSPFNEGDDRKAGYGFRGKQAGMPFASFEYHFDTTEGTGEHRHTVTHTFWVTILEAETKLPNLRVSPENAFERVVGRWLNSDINLESEDFNRAYHVQADEPKFAYDVLQPQLMEKLLTLPTRMDWSIRGGMFMVLQETDIDFTKLSQHLDLLKLVTSSIPAFVWKDHGGAPSIKGTESAA